MLRRQRQIRNGLLKIVDGVLFALGFFLAYYVRSSEVFLGTFVLDFLALFGGTKEIESFESFFPIMLLTLPVSLVLLEFLGFYDRPLLLSRGKTAWQLFKVCALVTIALVLMMFLVRIQLSRAVIILSGGISFVLVMVKEEVLRRYAELNLGRSQFRQRFILIGASEDTQKLYDDVLQDSKSNLQVVADLDVNRTSVEEFLRLLHEHSANGVIMSAKHTFFGQVEKVIQACELEGVEVWMLADFFHTEISRTILDDFNGYPMMVFRSAPDVSWQAVAKQTIDQIGACVALLVFAPILVFCAISIRLSSPGPILFRQQRSGLNGRPFEMYKFRSMVTDAEQQRRELEDMNEMDGPVFKLSEDPRVTWIGKFLRRRSFDELPQLFNVLKGEMSLVGPRPLPVDETLRFDDLAHRRRLSVKPGLTCLWQISGRNDVKDFQEWVRLDLEYIDNWSLWLDVKILLRTVPVVLLGTGAK
ncbi:MAG: UDP-glucose:undecaprenyl-phosphate glucose-1-phosphate transferase [Verrucomicrobia subdivision 3 bacterium]|nr:UDP-glucose:undecaprenyl-phosphate glucose-1-phosphate transferase [Limisphaerales bacterium]MCS1413827.1 UDP-glucose:undecaprenyl-phosphate glucose-1-phosphate transferase [Limisphaerales bacterium]